jgi:hypothetical protein
VDPVTRLVREAARRSGEAPRPLASARVGDARALDWPDATADLVLLLGPLYHLTERAERIQALREARRVLKPGGRLLAAAISRAASALDGLCRGLFADPRFGVIVARDLSDGQHRNTTERLDYFTTAYFHRPEELGAELAEAGLTVLGVYGIEGPAWLLSDIAERMEHEPHRTEVLAPRRPAPGVGSGGARSQRTPSRRGEQPMTATALSTLFVVAALALRPPMAQAAVPALPDSAMRQELLRALGEFRDAFARGDATTLDRLLTAEYVHTNGGSGQVLDRAAWLGYVRVRRAELDEGTLRIEQYHVTDPIIRFFGTSAVVVQQVSTAGVRQGEPFRSRVQVTQVWTHAGGRWRRAAFHDSPLEILTSTP